MNSTLISTIRTTACLAAVCALTAPAAALAVPADARPDHRRAQAPTSSPAETTPPSPWQDLRSPDARDAAEDRYLGKPPTPQDLRSPDTRDVAQGAYPTTTATREDVPRSGGLDWPSAAIGAATLGALLLLGYAALADVRRARTRAAA